MAYDNFDNNVDDIKRQVNIVDVIGREVKLKKSGSGYKGLCPFHSEKTASFSVNEQGQYFNCFGCGHKGDVIRFVMDYYKLPFYDAVDKICDDYGIKKLSRKGSGPRIDYDKYYDINAKAARFFYNRLGEIPNKGISYLVSRGLSKDTITAFGLGYAPADGRALTDHLISEGINEEDLITLGLSSKGKNGIYDKFRDRVIFPIINSNDKVIGFGGRAIGDAMPKYLNSPESVIFLKKNNLFGLNLTKREISNQDRAIIVEGYMDLISLYQAGVRNTAASLGTALTDNQARLICRYSKNIILSYDSDRAGINAALRGIDVISSAGGKVKVMNVYDGKDPDDFIKKHGKDEFNKLADDAIPATEYRLKLARSGYDLKDDRQVLEYIEKVVPILRQLGPVEQELYIKKISDEFGISERAISLSLQSGKESEKNIQKIVYRNTDKLRNNTQSDNIAEKLEVSMLLLVTRDHRYLKRFSDEGIIFKTALAEKIRSAAESAEASIASGSLGIEPKYISEVLDPDDEQKFEKYLANIRIGPDDEKFYNETKSSYMIGKHKDKRSEILNDLALAEKLNKTEEIEVLAGKLMELDDKIKSLTEE